MEKSTKSILEMAHGAILERVDYEMAKILDNILDANTKATAKRKMTLTLTFAPDDERATVAVSATAKTRTRQLRPCISRGRRVALKLWRWCRRSPDRRAWIWKSRKYPVS